MALTFAVNASEPADSLRDLNEVVVSASRGTLRMSGATNGRVITASELRRAACCNLGESFTTNPSVDVSYSDAATGARQIRLLGLSGSYVQMLTENIPNFRGAAAPYGLGYIPGPWMQSIQVSKGASSVKNGYESVTGQINVEMKKPQADPSLSVNAYYDMMNKLEANADGNLHFGEKWSAGLLTHFENGFSDHDSNDDGFSDLPRVRQVSLMPRVAYLGSRYVFQAALKMIDERRLSGQSSHHAIPVAGRPLYTIRIDTRRYEAMTKNAFMFDRDNDGNVAMILSWSSHDQDARYGYRLCDIAQTEAYGTLMFERKWNGLHALSTGVSVSFDDYHFNYRFAADPAISPDKRTDAETVTGAYGQYTLNIDDRLIAMAGLRYDYSNRYGSMVTPRVHIRYRPSESVSIHGSVGKGYRSPHPLAEYSYLLASSRRIEISPTLSRESALNVGVGASWEFRLGGKKMTLDGEYYFTRFGNQLMVDLDSDPHGALIYCSKERSRSHAVQFELTAQPLSELTLGLAWRLTDVRNRYLPSGPMVEKALTSRNKGLLTVGYQPMMGLWQFDLSLALNGGGRIPTPYRLADGTSSWASTFRPYTQLNAQITRNFRHWAVYVGGENLTNFRQPNPIVGAADPWGADFDATMIYGPLHGAMIYVGFRYNLTKYL